MLETGLSSDEMALGGFWCRVNAPCYPERSLCLLEKRQWRDSHECIWQQSAYCFPTVWGLFCGDSPEYCEDRAKAMRTSTTSALPPKERMPLGECRVMEYAW